MKSIGEFKLIRKNELIKTATLGAFEWRKLNNILCDTPCEKCGEAVQSWSGAITKCSKCAMYN